MGIYRVLLFINIILILILSFVEFEFFIKYKLYKYDFYFHSIMYSALSFLGMHQILFKNFKSFKSIIWRLIVFLLPISTEYFQKYLPSRATDLTDIYYDYCGMLFGIILFTIFKYVKTNKYQEFSNH